MSEYTVHIGEQSKFKVEPVSDSAIKINEAEIPWDCIQISAGQFHIIHKKRSFQVQLIEVDYDSKQFVLQVNDKQVELKAEDRFDALLHQLGMDSTANAALSELKAPMPGLVLDIPVKVGQEVKKDEPLAVLEAMKMENVLKSPGDLKVKSIAVKQGEAVEKNQVLIEFENE